MLPGKHQTARGFERMVGCVVRTGDSLAYLCRSCAFLFFSVLFSEQLCSGMAGRALALAELAGSLGASAGPWATVFSICSSVHLAYA